MEAHHLISSSLLHSLIPIFFFFFLIAFVVPTSYSEDDESFATCNQTYNCGKLQGFDYPFWGGGDDRPDFCGHEGFMLTCQENNDYPLIDIDNQTFRVLAINETDQTILISRKDVWEDNCPEKKFTNTTLNETIFAHRPDTTSLSIFYRCPFELSTQVPNNFNCSISGGNGKGGAFYLLNEWLEWYLDKALTMCDEVIEVLIPAMAIGQLQRGNMEVKDALNQMFELEYHYADIKCSACKKSGGICGSNSSSLHEFVCLCRDQPHPLICQSHGNETNISKKLFIGIGAGIFGMLLISIAICCFRRMVSSNNLIKSWKRNRTNDQNVEVFLRQHGALAPKRYSYSDIKKITTSLKDKLGQGGYGGVYKGKLLDGRLVAVKVLKESKGNGEEFINEVASISRTSHVNVVTLLGFCFEGHRRALIYEFMPNGSLEKFIYGGNTSLTNDRNLGWEKLYEIALGIARGLEYLHLGCNTRILHFDIKPHNILLDEDFCPKIADFGLAKLCLGKESIISMLGARGTIGYIAPEIYNRNFGGVSHKSDVYSYGSMILEMVGGRKNIKIGVSQTSEIYFPHWIYKRLELENDFILEGVMTEGENEIARKMVLVGLWCIQTDPLQRPSISKVIDMLGGSIEALQIPPKPFLSSPPRSLANSSTPSTTSII